VDLVDPVSLELCSPANMFGKLLVLLFTKNAGSEGNGRVIE